MLTLSDVKTVVARVLGVSTQDSRVAEYVSRAQERLLHKGKWVGTHGRYRVCVNDSCLTWPREIETIEAAAICSTPIEIRNGWYEFLGTGPGVVGENAGCARGLIDRENSIAFDDVKGTGKKLAFYADSAVDAGAQILVRYYDSNGNKYYTTDSDGNPIEGEYLTLVAPPAYVYSTNQVLAGGYYGFIKPVTKRMVRSYEYTVAGGALKPLGYYEPDETNPQYRRSLIPGISDSCNGNASTSECGTSTIDIVGKFRHRTVRKDNDALIIDSVEAIRLAVQAVRKEEDNLFDDAENFWNGRYNPVKRIREGGAVGVLQDQLEHWQGSGTVVPIRIAGADVWGGGVPNLI